MSLLVKLNIKDEGLNESIMRVESIKAAYDCLLSDDRFPLSELAFLESVLAKADDPDSTVVTCVRRLCRFVCASVK